MTWRMRQIATCALLFTLLSAGGVAQVAFEREVDPFPVREGDGVELWSPFSGGLLAPRIGLTDIDADGLPDLLALNTGDDLRTYRNRGDGTFTRVFPSPYDSAPVRAWFRLVDLSGDGAIDLLTSGSRSELLLYRNDGSATHPTWILPPDTLRHDTIIFTQQETVPSLVDIDGDGDLDLFSGNIEGSITFYRNIGAPDDPRFRLETGRYMDILVVSNGTRRKEEEGPSLTAKHGASVLDFADIDGDGDLDLFFGDFFTERLLFFPNSGTAQQASFSMATLDTAFGAFGPLLYSPGFNQPVAGDLDGDGDLDMIVSSLYPNSPFPPLQYFENVGTVTAPELRRRGRPIVGELDLGASSAPTPIDDRFRRGLLIGTSDGLVTYLELVGVEGDRAMVVSGSMATSPGLFNVAPAAGDLDGDGVAEVVIGSADENALRLFRFDGPRLQRLAWELDTASVPRYAVPALGDLDGDGDLDLLCGGSNGRLLYFRNDGGAGAHLFRRATPPPGLDTLDLGTESAPALFDIDRDGDLDLVLGGRPSQSSDRGVMMVLRNDGGTFVPWSDVEIEDVPSSPVPALLPIDTALYMMAGTRWGGLVAWVNRAYAASVDEQSTSATAVELRGSEVIGAQPGSVVRLHDLLGRLLWSGTVPASGRIDLPRSIDAPLLFVTLDGRVIGRLRLR